VTESDPNLGKVLQGRYRILSPIAAGGMGVVYRGERVGLSRPVAIKFVWPALAQVEHARKRFETEALAMSRLTHPSCVGVIDFGVEDGSPYLVMDFASGRTLKAALEEGRLPPARALEITKQILGGLAHAHGQQIIHRDIKPDNIVLSETEGFGVQVRILDFGLAKLKDSVSGMTVGFAVGTPSYMSPEQTVADVVDARSDLYSVGVMLFEMLTGTKPLKAEKVQELLHMHREVTPPKLRERAPEVEFSSELEAVVAKAMAKAPSARFASAAEFAAALDATPETRTPPPTKPAKSGEETVSARRVVPPRPTRSLKRMGLLVGIVGIAGTFLLVWVLRSSNPAAPPAAPPVVIDKPRVEPATMPTTPAPGATASPTRVPGIDEAEALIRAGRETAALESLRKLRAKHPRDPEVAYLMGNVFCQRMWWSDGFEAYRTAVSGNPAYRQDPVLISNVVKSLISERHAGIGEHFIEHEIGSAAVPALEEASKSSSPNVRSRAARLLAKLKR
jgi:serine/threonine-protein kinase